MRTHWKGKASSVYRDGAHPGRNLFQPLPSGKRFRASRTKTNRPKSSLYPNTVASIALLPQSSGKALWTQRMHGASSASQYRQQQKKKTRAAQLFTCDMSHIPTSTSTICNSATTCLNCNKLPSRVPLHVLSAPPCSHLQAPAGGFSIFCSSLLYIFGSLFAGEGWVRSPNAKNTLSKCAYLLLQ